MKLETATWGGRPPAKSPEIKMVPKLKYVTNGSNSDISRFEGGLFQAFLGFLGVWGGLEKL